MPTVKYSQGYNDKLDESLSMKDGKSSTKSQSYKSRRDESKAMSKKLYRNAQWLIKVKWRATSQ